MEDLEHLGHGFQGNREMALLSFGFCFPNEASRFAYPYAILQHLIAGPRVIWEPLTRFSRMDPKQPCLCHVDYGRCRTYQHTCLLYGHHQGLRSLNSDLLLVSNVFFSRWLLPLIFIRAWGSSPFHGKYFIYRANSPAWHYCFCSSLCTACVLLGR